MKVIQHMLKVEYSTDGGIMTHGSTANFQLVNGGAQTIHNLTCLS